MSELTIPAAMCDTEGRLVWMTDLLLELMGKQGDAHSCVGGSADMLLYGEERGHASIFARTLSLRVESHDAPCETRRRDGRPLQTAARRQPGYGPQEELIGAFVCLTDLTAIRKQEAAILRQNEAIMETAERADVLTTEVEEAVSLLTAQIEQTRKQAARQQALG